MSERPKNINNMEILNYLEQIKPPVHEPLKMSGVRVVDRKFQLVNPFTTSFGTIKELTRFYPVIKFKTQDGKEIQGIGECPPLPYPWYDGEAHDLTQIALGQYLIPLLKQFKGEITNVKDFLRIYGGVTGVQRNFMAKVGLEGAYWDAVGKLTGQPVYKLWGGEISQVEAGTSVGGRNIEETLERIERAVEMGVRRVKVKIKPGFDVSLVEAIRKRYPNLLLQVDANSSYDLLNPDHIEVLKALDKFGLLMIEQPLWNDDRYYHLMLSREIETPICLDESIENARHAAEAIEMWKNAGILDRLIINIKPPRVGGFWEAVKIAKLCRRYGVRTWCGGMLESALGKTANVHFSTLTDLPGDHVSQGKYFIEDIADSPLLEDGYITVPQEPGWGVRNLKL